MANEGAPVKVPILGINRSGSSTTIDDGSCNEVIGLEYKDGCLVPFEPIKTLCDVTEFDNVWIHKTSHQTNYIYLQGRNLYWQSEADALAGRRNLILIDTIGDKVKRIDFINNILCYNKVTHLFKNGKYNMFSLPQIDFKMNIGATGNGVAVMYDGVLDEKDTLGVKSLNKLANEIGLVDRISTNFQTLEGEVRKADYISGACFLRYALKLYDGSYINPSEPVLFLPDTYYNINGYSYNNPMKFGLRDERVVSNGVISGLAYPAVDFIPALVGSTMFWSMIPYFDKGEGKLVNLFKQGFNKINECIDNQSMYPISDIDDNPMKDLLPHTFYEKVSKYQRPSYDYYVNSKGTTGFRERIQFNNTEFKRDHYYKYDKKRDELTYDYDLYRKSLVTGNSFASGALWGESINLSDKTRGRGWTWGVLPCAVSALEYDTWDNFDDGINFSVWAMTFPVDVFGQKSLMYHTAAAWKRGKYRVDYYSQNSDENVRYQAGAKNWFSTFWGLPEEYTFKDYIALPQNHHIGEIGFCAWNVADFEGSPAAKDSNVNMVFGRELYTPMYEIVNNIPEEYKDLVLGVDIFMSRPVSMHKDKHQDGQVFTNLGAHRPYKAKQELALELEKTLDSFYKIHSIQFDELVKHVPNRTVIPYIERGKIGSLELQQKLVDFGRSTFDYDISYVYNNKLHIAQITENLFKGYNDSTSQFPSRGYVEAERAIYSPEEREAAQESKTLARKNLLISTFQLKDKIHNYRFSIVGKINIRVDDILDSFDFEKPIRWEDEYPFNLSFFYPDYRAESVQIDGIQIKDITFNTSILVSIPKTMSLTSDKSNNLSYLISFDNDDSFSSSKLSALTFDDSSTIIPNSIIRDRDENVFKVSKVNNPLVYPYAQTYRAGYGKIVGFSSNAVALSQGQYGMYPLYVFTDSGIFAMKVDASFVGTYSDNTPISREVCNNPNSIVQVDGGVFFSSEKGLMLLSGNETTLFSSLINGEPDNTPDKNSLVVGDGLKVYANAVENAQLVNLSGSISQIDFREYLSNINTFVSYIYEKNKLMVYNKYFNYSYLIDLSTSVCTKIAKSIAFDTKNYPSSLYGILSGTKRLLYKMTIDGEDFANDVLIQTRPIKLSPEVIKSSYRVVLRGLFIGEKDKTSGIYVMGSLDGERWMYMGGSERKHVDGIPIKDIGTTIERNSCKFLMIVYVGSLLPESKIENIEITTGEKYNDKIR